MHKFTSLGSSLLLLLLLYCLSGCSSNMEKSRSFKTIFDQYRDKDGVVAIGFPPGLLSLVLDQDDPEQRELKGLMKELSSFSMLFVEEGSQTGELKEELSTACTKQYKKSKD